MACPIRRHRHAKLSRGQRRWPALEASRVPIFGSVAYAADVISGVAAPSSLSRSSAARRFTTHPHGNSAKFSLYYNSLQTFHFVYPYRDASRQQTRGVIIIDALWWHEWFKRKKKKKESIGFRIFSNCHVNGYILSRVRENSLGIRRNKWKIRILLKRRQNYYRRNFFFQLFVLSFFFFLIERVKNDSYATYIGKRYIQTSDCKYFFQRKKNSRKAAKCATTK